MTDHICRFIPLCTCWLLALEPRDSCEVHGYSYRRRCECCGRFMKQEANR